MTNDDMENKEWLDDYLSLKQVNPNNPFTVPAGYFDELDERIISAIKLDELKNTISPDCFTVPQNYFEELNSNIQSRINVEAKLNTKNSGLTIPENYFENLTGQIQTRILVEEALNNSEGALTVPPNYFNELNKNILNKTVAQETVKRKGAVIRFITSTAFKYATAACFVLVVGASLLFNPVANTLPTHNDSYLHKELSNIPADEIRGYIELSMDANDTQHTVDIENLPVNDADLNTALQDYVN